MKKYFLALALLSGAAGYAQSQPTKWTVDASHTTVAFTIPHFNISETEGKFTKFAGNAQASKADFSDAKIDFAIDPNSIDTDNADRDKHLRAPDFLDAEKYQQIAFKSKALKPVGTNKYKLTGDFTMHGVTREVVLDVVYRGTVPKDPYGNTKAGFKITGVLDRTLWGLKWNGKLASGDVFLGNEVALNCNLELQQIK